MPPLRVCHYNGCDYSYYQHTRYEDHLASAHGKYRKRHSCSECPASYRRRDDLRRHERDKHSSKGGVLVTCPDCKRKFKQRSLKRHQRNSCSNIRTESSPAGNITPTHGKNSLLARGDMNECGDCAISRCDLSSEMTANVKHTFAGRIFENIGHSILNRRVTQQMSADTSLAVHKHRVNHVRGANLPFSSSITDLTPILCEMLTVQQAFLLLDEGFITTKGSCSEAWSDFLHTAYGTLFYLFDRILSSSEIGRMISARAEYYSAGSPLLDVLARCARMLLIKADRFCNSVGIDIHKTCYSQIAALLQPKNANSVKVSRVGMNESITIIYYIPVSVRRPFLGSLAERRMFNHLKQLYSNRTEAAGRNMALCAAVTVRSQTDTLDWILAWYRRDVLHIEVATHDTRSEVSSLIRYRCHWISPILAPAMPPLFVVLQPDTCHVLKGINSCAEHRRSTAAR